MGNRKYLRLCSLDSPMEYLYLILRSFRLIFQSFTVFFLLFFGLDRRMCNAIEICLFVVIDPNALFYRFFSHFYCVILLFEFRTIAISFDKIGYAIWARNIHTRAHTIHNISTCLYLRHVGMYCFVCTPLVLTCLCYT